MKSEIKSIAKLIIPDPMINLYRRLRLYLYRNHNRKLSAKEIFTRIYQENEWGGKVGDFCSGTGSNEYFTSLYGEVVKDFIKEKNISTVVDLGCGDFAAGKKLLVKGMNYLGVDIVEELIKKNQMTFSGDNVSFVLLDIISDPLPKGELCLIRQVFQHLSNTQILSVIQKLETYKYILVTEHYPADSVHPIPNKDKPCGGDTRIHDNSAVYLDSPPFNMTISKIVLETEVPPIVAKGERIITFLIENNKRSQ